MLNEIILITLIDTLYYILKYIYNFNHSKSTKWFFVHSLTNFFIAYYSINDIILCLGDLNNCYSISWTNDSYIVYKLSLLLHIYHMLLYKLNKTDLVHHFIMCGICGPLIYYKNTIISSLCLFFMSGLPGMIDYFTLFLVKIGKVSSIKQKNNYILISIWLRSPGCLFSVFLSIQGLINYYNTNLIDFLLFLIMSSLIFWNGQYYLMITINDYIKYTSIIQ